MSVIKLTSKRQATFPAEVCRKMGVGPGDSLILEPIERGAETLWLLKPAKGRRPSWFGRLKGHARKAAEPWSRESHGNATARAMAEDENL